MGRALSPVPRMPTSMRTGEDRVVQPRFQLFAMLVLGVGLCANTGASAAQEYGFGEEGGAAFGVGFAAVKFDTKLKFVDKESGTSVFVDPEGDLDLPEVSHVNTLYGAYRFRKKHVIGFSYFGINREATWFQGELNLDDVAVVSGEVSLSDRTDFFMLSYGYSLFQDARSDILGLVGVYTLDMNYVLEATGELTIDGETARRSYREEASFIAPLPLFGFNFHFAFTPEWSMMTKVAFVGGSYQGVSATVLQSMISAHYKFTKHLQGVVGLAYFDADVDIDDESSADEIAYGYNGGYAGLHVVF